MKQILPALLFISSVYFLIPGKLIAQAAVENETTIRAYLDGNRLDPIEGIYKSMGGAYYRIGIRKTAENKYTAYVLDMDPRLAKRWKIGDVKANLERSTVPRLYSIRWLWNDKQPEETVASFENNIIRMDDMVGTLKYLKIYPAASVNLP